MIGVAMIVSIDIASHSANTAFELSTNILVGQTTHEIVGVTQGFDEEIYTQIRTEVGWQYSAPVVTDYVIAYELDQQPLLLVGLDPFAERPFRDYVTPDNTLKFESTHANDLQTLGQFMMQPNTVLMGQDLATQYHIQPNDQITLQIGAYRTTVTVVGLLHASDNLTNQALQGVLIADISTAQELLGMEGQLSRIDLIFDLDNPQDQAVYDLIKTCLPPGVELQPSATRTDALRDLAKTFRLNLTAMSLLAMLVAMFLVYNTVMFSVIQRRSVIGILRTIGVTRRQVFTLILLEVALVSSVGTLLGIGLGIVLGQSAVNLVTRTINDSFFILTVRTVTLTYLMLIKSVVVGIGLALFATLLPAFEATFTPPINSSQRSQIEERVRRLLPAITIFGIFLALGGSLLLLIDQLLLNFGGVFAIIMGLTLLTGYATLFTMKMMQPLTARVGGIIGRMAPYSITRNLSRTSVAIAALMVSVSVIIGVRVMTYSLQSTVETWLSDTLKADFYIEPANQAMRQVDRTFDPDLINIVQEVDGVTQVVYTRTVLFAYSTNDDEALQITAIMADDTPSRHKFVHKVGGSNMEIMQRVIQGDGILLTENLANNRDIEWHSGLTLTLLTAQGPYEFPVLGIFTDYTSTQGGVIIGMETYQSLWKDKRISRIGVYIEPSADERAVAQRLREELAGYELLVLSNNERRTSALEVFDQIFAITDALNGLATGVAFIGILSTLMALQLERQREMGILRANGLTHGQLFKLTLWETGLMGFMAGTLALPIGLLLSLIFIYVINLRSFGWTIDFGVRWQFLAEAYLVALGSALLAGLYPAWRAGHIQPAEALRSE